MILTDPLRSCPEELVAVKANGGDGQMAEAGLSDVHRSVVHLRRHRRREHTAHALPLVEPFGCTDLPHHARVHHHVLSLVDSPSPKVGGAWQTWEVHQVSALKQTHKVGETWPGHAWKVHQV